MAQRLADGPAISAAYGVPCSTLRTWQARGKLTDHGHDRRGRALYDLAEVELVLGRSPRTDEGTRLGGCLSPGCTLPGVPAAPVLLCVPHLVAVADYATRARLVATGATV
jgi:hypothetical protein